MKNKVVLYCFKEKPYLYDLRNVLGMFDIYDVKQAHFNSLLLNGKAIAECDYDADNVEYKHIKERDKFGILHNEAWYEYKGLNVSHYECDLASRSGFENSDILFDYLFETLRNKEGYPQDGKAIHISNVNVFNEPRDVNRYLLTRVIRGLTDGFYIASEIENERVIIIAVSPQEACNILNGKQDTIIRKTEKLKW
jgi:hypothetical protein